ncbi:hypothetical protein Tco_0330867 [Tanacetum coccineum]
MDETTPYGSGTQEQLEEFDAWQDGHGIDDDDVPNEEVSLELLDEVARKVMTSDELQRMQEALDDMLRNRCDSAKTLKKDSPFAPDSKTNVPPLRPYQLWKKAHHKEALRKSDKMHQTCEKSSLAMTTKLDDIIELPKSLPKKTNMEDLDCEMVWVDMPSATEVPSFDEPEPQPQTLPSCPPLHVSLGDKKGPEPPIKPHSLDSFRM